jgi:hypothetical protein
VKGDLIRPYDTASECVGAAYRFYWKSAASSARWIETPGPRWPYRQLTQDGLLRIVKSRRRGCICFEITPKGYWRGFNAHQPQTITTSRGSGASADG